ncbi:hypothetical protein TNCV_1005241 [Trichonephila clavipes]|nr:hypothetical protein TNCV_872981 [Trichonephila clavipes]GFU05744.1 hypothetical protein TNCV_1005241 [Trichonephila clavipes]
MRQRTTQLEIVISKSDNKTRFVLTARTSVTRHVIQNAPNPPNLKGAAFSNPIARKIFPVNGQRGISFSNIVSGEIPSQTPTKIENQTVNERKTLPEDPYPRK